MSEMQGTVETVFKNTLMAKVSAEITWVHTLADEDGHPKNRDIDKVEMFIAFFSSVFNTSDGLKGSQYPELED